MVPLSLGGTSSTFPHLWIMPTLPVSPCQSHPHPASFPSVHLPPLKTNCWFHPGLSLPRAGTSPKGGAGPTLTTVSRTHSSAWQYLPTEKDLHSGCGMGFGAHHQQLTAKRGCTSMCWRTQQPANRLTSPHHSDHSGNGLRPVLSEETQALSFSLSHI